MQRKFINLQHFAEETNPQGGDPANTEPNSKGGDGKTGEPKYTDEDVNRLLNKKFAEWQKKKEAEISEAQKLAEMNEQEKAEHQRDQLQKELDELKQKDALAEMSKTARKMLSDSGVSISEELLSVLVTADAEETKKAVNSFADLFKTAVKNAVSETLKSPAPTTSTSGSVTKEQIMAIKDRAARQKAINENIELFK